MANFNKIKEELEKNKVKDEDGKKITNEKINNLNKLINELVDIMQSRNF